MRQGPTVASCAYAYGACPAGITLSQALMPGRIVPMQVNNLCLPRPMVQLVLRN